MTIRYAKNNKIHRNYGMLMILYRPTAYLVVFEIWRQNDTIVSSSVRLDRNLTCFSVNGGINTREAKGDTTRRYYTVYFDGETSRDMYRANCDCNVHNFSIQFKVKERIIDLSLQNKYCELSFSTCTFLFKF